MYQFRTCQSVEDAEIIAKLAEEIWNEYFTPIIGKQQVAYMLRTMQSKEAIARAVFEEGYRYDLATTEEGEPVAYCGFCAERKVRQLFLSKLYVKQSERKKGLAGKLLRRAVAYAKELDLDSIYLTVNKQNDLAIQVYRHMGFVRKGEQEKAIGGGFVMDDYIYQLSLSPSY